METENVRINPIHKNMILIGFAIGVLALAFLGGIIFAAMKLTTKETSTGKTKIPTQVTTTTISPTVQATNTLTPTQENWLTYTDSINKFSFKYPSKWELTQDAPNYIAEGYTQAQVSNCHATNVILTTPEGYVLSIDYAMDGCPQGASNYIFHKSIATTIAGGSHLKVYANNCDGSPDFSTCTNQFGTIVYADQADVYNQNVPQGNSQVGRYFKLNGKLSDIVFSLDSKNNQKFLPLDDAGFASTNALLDQLVASIQTN